MESIRKRMNLQIGCSIIALLTLAGIFMVAAVSINTRAMLVRRIADSDQRFDRMDNNIRRNDERILRIENIVREISRIVRKRGPSDDPSRPLGDDGLTPEYREKMR